ncbi:uncharacterized protein PGTG_20461 [Puccinia graminis f. sp. tritici CRL 75-36-700-3]|uniref:Uncharacterized protein n=1 Tax=Puccinia graminis f. sp. tritici (strain CRL 75-36-700-3 / race SCCL) TaxID=418459 RepID=E3NY56_PUCGT|nr:uncharacterized protein PGTG_20461 [Puccinia graminis f. sp. tritici CRL 75-36-700-3]EFP94505.2 hypothetical protein PGTG_20461 [Puccinia graminis f. sp. tritici CRL 75-36-700-3]
MVLENEKVHPADWENPGRVKSTLCYVKIGLLLRPLETVGLKLPPPTAKDQNSTPLPNINHLPYNSPAVSHGFLAMAEAEAQKPTESSGTAIEDAPGSKNKGTKGPGDTTKNSKAAPKKKKGKK